MAAKVSAEMKHARELIREGMKPAEAARQAGVTKGAISVDIVCRALVDTACPGKLAKAVQMVKASKGRITAYQAAQAVGIHQSAISRSADYQSFMETLKNA